MSDTSTTQAEEVVEGQEQSQIVEYNPLRAEIKRLAAAYSGATYDVSSTKGLEEAKKARKDIRDVRYAIQNTEKAVLVPYQQKVKDAQEDVRKVKDFAASMCEAVLKLESPIDEVIKAEEQRRLEEKAERERIERERREALQAKITGMRNAPLNLAAATSAQIAEKLAELQAVEIGTEEFGDMAGEALEAKFSAVEQLQTLHTSATQREEQARQLAAQQEELERLRQEREQREKAEREERERKEREEREAFERERADFERQREEFRRQQQSETVQVSATTVQPAEPAPVEIPAPAAEPVAEASADQPADLLSLVEQTEDALHDSLQQPSAQQLVDCVVETFGCSDEQAREWLRSTEF